MDLICPTAQAVRAPDVVRQIGTTGNARLDRHDRVKRGGSARRKPDHHCLKCKVDHTRFRADRANHWAYFERRSFAMTDVPLIAKVIPRPGSWLIRRGKRGFFALMLDALHHSRRLQAERTLRRYQHLIGPAQANILRELNARAEPPKNSG
jgi:hypothetical protein